MYTEHQSKVLVETFVRKPYQGVAPDRAKILFIGLDANYANDIEQESVFRKILEYHEDGVSFWKKYRVHHPFLLPEYAGSGRLYHKNFACIGLTESHADLISFTELLHVPTTERNILKVSDLNTEHLSRINEWIVEGASEFIFLSDGVFRLMKQSKHFPWLPSKPGQAGDGLTIIKQWSGKTIYKHLHFSNYGKFKKQMNEEASALYSLLSNNG